MVKPGQVFSRIHVDDIAAVLAASMARPDPGRAYNVADDEPAPPQDVIAFAAELLGLPVPPEVPLRGGGALADGAELLRASRSGCANRRIKAELGVRLAYPDYRAGLRGDPRGGRLRDRRNSAGEICRDSLSALAIGGCIGQRFAQSRDKAPDGRR